jgi:hypothetical protein
VPSSASVRSRGNSSTRLTSASILSTSMDQGRGSGSATTRKKDGERG